MNLEARRSQRGAGLLELLAVVALAGLVAAVAAPSLWQAYQRQQNRAVATQAVQAVRYARVMALKEKVRHRVVFHDASAATANTVEVQREQSGSFVTVVGHVYTAPDGVSILGSGSTDSVDSVTVGTRGECDAGDVFIRGRGESLEVVSIGASCHTSQG